MWSRACKKHFKTCAQKADFKLFFGPVSLGVPDHLILSKELAMSSNLLGACVMLLGMAVFAANDAIGKWLVADYGVGQVVLLRSLAALLILLVVLRGKAWTGMRQAPQLKLQILRAACATLEVFCFYYAVVHLPLADVMAFWMAAPIYVLAASPLLLRERVGPMGWLTVAIGFVGVLCLLGPSLQVFELTSIIAALVGTGAYALMMLLGRRLRATPDTSLVLFQTCAALIGGALFVPFDWRPIQAGIDLGLLFLLGIVAMSAHLLVTRALKLADASVVAPLQYTLLVFGVVFGILFFGDVPTPAMSIGAGLIVLSGLLIFFQSQKKAEPPSVAAQ